MLKLMSGTALAIALTTPAWGQTASYGEPLGRMAVEVCSPANGSPSCRGVPDWGIAPQAGIVAASRTQPGTVAGDDVDLEEWQAGAGRGSTGAEGARAGAAGVTAGAEADDGEDGTGDTAAGDTGDDDGAGDTDNGDTAAGGTGDDDAGDDDAGGADTGNGDTDDGGIGGGDFSGPTS